MHGFQSDLCMLVYFDCHLRSRNVDTVWNGGNLEILMMYGDDVRFCNKYQNKYINLVLMKYISVFYFLNGTLCYYIKYMIG
jgi:hypothetical protein